MKKLIATLALLIITVSSVYSQSLKDITSNSFILKDSIYKSNIDSTITKKPVLTKTEKKGDFITLSTGIMISDDEKPIFGSFDMNINLGFISEIFYLNMGVYVFNEESSAFGAHFTPGIGFDFYNKRIFAFAGAGYFFLYPAWCYDLALRVNYNISKQLSAGFDNKIIFFSASSNLRIYSTGLNFSYRFNY